MPDMNKELVPMETPTFELNTFIAVDVWLPVSEEIRRLVGTVTRSSEEFFVLENPDSKDKTVIEKGLVRAGWWAPMGYRP